MEPMQAMQAEYTLTVPEAAAILGETEQDVHRLIYTARLDAIRVRGLSGPEFRIRPSDVLARSAESGATETSIAAPPAEVPAVRGDTPPCCQSGWVDVYRELFLRYDRLGRRAARLERENHLLRHALKEMEADGSVRG